ncbi:uncharacterized protein LAJ45_04657 [Morchella importuna]|uniref:uncharacterized protein n=1 Tax=Morchella importuna TaxID=1174673 RepID=UPI001E8D6AAD|nr:uncharacterized protein LAJ45_04657 [Morchella importuna]KAH8151452.1 hypothetical protein LAJ45_04657 [Morchella importuna]
MSVSFPQNGTVDWTSLTSMTVSVPLTLMSRLSQAGVDQYTLELVKFYGQFMNLPSQHLEVVEKSLLQAKKFGFSANALFVGTGISLVPSLLARTRGGIAFSAVTMALRASFEANFTARVLSEWLSFFERPAELSLPSVSQLQAVSNEVAGCPIDPEIGHVIWGLEQLFEKNSGTKQFKPPTSLTAPPLAQDLARAIHTVLTIRPNQNVVMRFKSSVGPSATWLAAFASKTVGLSVSLEIGNKIVWEQQEKYCATLGSRGHLRLVIEVSMDAGGPKQLQVMKSASVEITLQRHETSVETSFRISPKAVVDRMLEEIFDNAEQQNLARECICKAAHHISQKPAVFVKQTGMSLKSSNSPSVTATYLINKNQAKTALTLLGIDPDSIDLWITEAKAEIAKGQTQKILDRNGPLPKWTVEETLIDYLGLPFLTAFKRLHDASQQVYTAKEPGSWTKLRLDDFKRILTLWTVLTFVSVLVPGKDVISLDGRRVYSTIERSNGIFSSFGSLWQLYYCKLNDEGFMEYVPIRSFEASTGNQEGIFKTHCLLISAIHGFAFNLLGGHMELIGSSNDDTAGVVSGGTFVVMSTLLESNPARPRDAMTIFVGQGSIFVNQQATFCLKSLSRAFNEPSDFKSSSELQQFGQTHPYISENNDSSDLTQIKMNMSLYVSEKPDISYVAWSLNGRDGTDVLFDVLLSPHQILHNLVHAHFIDFDTPAGQPPPYFIKKPFSERYKADELFAENVEELCSGRTNGLVQLAMASKNHAAQILALHYALCDSLVSSNIYLLLALISNGSNFGGLGRRD